MKRKELRLNDNLFITLEKDSKNKNILTVRLDGRVDSYNANSFLRELKKMADRGYNQFIFDCSSLQYLSSAGVAIFTKLQEISGKTRGSFFLVNLQPKLVELIKLVNFAHLFEYAPDVEIARIVIKNRIKNDTTLPEVDDFDREDFEDRDYPDDSE